MAKIAIWCRHTNDNIIGIGPKIPWHVSSDFKRFKRLTTGHHLVAGQTTYESFPNRTLPDRFIHVLTFDKNYVVSDPQNHFVHTDIRDFDFFDEHLFICGGASIYKLFMADDNRLPDIIVDSEYLPDLPTDLTGTPVDITPCVRKMKSVYEPVSAGIQTDNIITTVWLKKGLTPPPILARILRNIQS